MLQNIHARWSTNPFFSYLLQITLYETSVSRVSVQSKYHTVKDPKYPCKMKYQTFLQRAQIFISEALWLPLLEYLAAGWLASLYVANDSTPMLTNLCRQKSFSFPNIKGCRHATSQNYFVLYCFKCTCLEVVKWKLGSGWENGIWVETSLGHKHGNGKIHITIRKLESINNFNESYGEMFDSEFI
jgi:hypothetical protein